MQLTANNDVHDEDLGEHLKRLRFSNNLLNPKLTVALRVLELLKDNEPTTAQELAVNTRLSKPYIYILFKHLVSAGFVRVVRGNSGGYVRNMQSKYRSVIDLAYALGIIQHTVSNFAALSLIEMKLAQTRLQEATCKDLAFNLQ